MIMKKIGNNNKKGITCTASIQFTQDSVYSMMPQQKLGLQGQNFALRIFLALKVFLYEPAQELIQLGGLNYPSRNRLPI